MNKYQMKAEIWELQVWIMWCLALGLYETEHYVLFGLVLLWSIISFAGALAFTFKGKAEEHKDATSTDVTGISPTR